jgi:hypothetical protein
MHDRLNTLRWWIRSAIGRLTGNTSEGPNGRPSLTPTSTMREAQRVSRPSVSRFREAVGQMTHDERLVALAESDRQQDKATRSE